MTDIWDRIMSHAGTTSEPPERGVKPNTIWTSRKTARRIRVVWSNPETRKCGVTFDDSTIHTTSWQAVTSCYREV